MKKSALLFGFILFSTVPLSRGGTAEEAAPSTSYYQRAKIAAQGWVDAHISKSVKRDWPSWSDISLPALPSVSLPERPGWTHIQLPDRSSLAAWTPSAFKTFDWNISEQIALIEDRLPSMPSFSAWLKNGDLPSGTVIVDLRQAIAEGWAMVPQDPRWWTDFAITTASVGTVVGWATFGCAIVATPGGPILVALASGACASVGASGGAQLVQLGYQWADMEVDRGALAAGRLLGMTLGASIGISGANEYLAALRFNQFQDYGGYAYAARSLTRQSMRPIMSSVRAAWTQGFDIDHIIPVKCGWKFGILPDQIGSAGNLQALPAAINRSIGAKGC